MPLTRVPVHASPVTVAASVTAAPEASLADILLAQTMARGTSWAPFAARSEITPEVWARWSAWLLARLQERLDGRMTDHRLREVTAEDEWLAETLGTLVTQEHPHRVRLARTLRRMVGVLGPVGPFDATQLVSAALWWRAQLATRLAAGQLGVTCAAEVTNAVQPWIDPTVLPLVPISLRWIAPALTVGLERGVLTPTQVVAFLARGGAAALSLQFSTDPAMLAVPGWRAAWWMYLQDVLEPQYSGQYEIAFRQHVEAQSVRWSAWSATEIGAWWTWMMRGHARNDDVSVRRLLAVLTAVVAKAPDGPWLAAHPAFRLALGPLLESDEAAVREVGLRALGLTQVAVVGTASGPEATETARPEGAAVPPRRGTPCR